MWEDSCAVTVMEDEDEPGSRGFDRFYRCAPAGVGGFPQSGVELSTDAGQGVDGRRVVHGRTVRG